MGRSGGGGCRDRLRPGLVSLPEDPGPFTVGGVRTILQAEPAEEVLVTAWSRIRRYPLRYRFWGLLFSRRFTKAGWLAVGTGFPKPRLVNRGGTACAGNCLFYRGVRLEVGRGAQLTIGDQTFLNRNVEVIAWQEVIIGSRCEIGWDVVIMDTDQHPASGRPRPVRIGDRVRIGARAIILKGVTIGDDVVVGAGAIVTRDVPPGATVVGPSARELQREQPPRLRTAQ
jgi:acetyltransferase-like isoleucine patch superfamily enzyme